MKFLNIMLIVGLASLAMITLFSSTTLAQQDLVVASSVTSAVFALGDDASAQVLPVHKSGGGKFHGGFRGGFFLGYPGWGYGRYGGYPLGYGYTGSYLDTPTRTCVWNGYNYRCYDFQSGDSYLY